MTYFFIALIFLDLALVGLLLYSNHQKGRYLDIIKELHEERQLFNELKAEAQSRLEQVKREGKSFVDRVTVLATEAELEIVNGREALKGNLQSIVSELTPQLEKPLVEIGKKQASLEKTLRKVEQQRDLMLKAIARGENIIKFFNKEVPYEQIIEELKDKKYEDARSLLSQGMPPLEVARELNIPEMEVRMIAGLNIS